MEERSKLVGKVKRRIVCLFMVSVAMLLLLLIQVVRDYWKYPRLPMPKPGVGEFKMPGDAVLGIQ